MPTFVTRLTAATIGLAAVLAAPAMTTLAQAPDRIDLPAGWRPEGVTSRGDQLFVGSLNGGAIWQADSNTGEGSILVPGVKGKVALGVEAEAANGRLWVAGGRTGEVRAYDIDSGKLLKVYPFKAGFINDLVATPEAIYATDSFMPQILVIPLRPDGGLRSPGQTTTIPLSGDLVYDEDGFNANGIVATPAGLIVVQSEPGALFRVDAETGQTSAIDAGDTELVWGDGLEIDGQTLYVVRNRFETVTVVALDDAFETATWLAELTSADLDIPATAALTSNGLWAANARFGTPNSAQNEFWLTRLEVPMTLPEATPDASPLAEGAED